MFSMAVLAVMVSVALDKMTRVPVAFWASALVDKFLLGGDSGSLTSQALQQGGMGLILTTLILTAPPMAAMFFQGTLGNFMAYSQIGGSPGMARPGPQGQPPGSYGGGAHSPASISSANADHYVGSPRFTSSDRSPSTSSPGVRGNAQL